MNQLVPGYRAWIIVSIAVLVLVLLPLAGLYYSTSDKKYAEESGSPSARSLTANSENKDAVNDSIVAIAPEYFAENPVVVPLLIKEVLDQINDGDGQLVSIHMKKINIDQYFDLFITMSSPYPNFYHYVFLWNPEVGKFVNITPDDKMGHPVNDLRYNFYESAFCSEYHGKKLGSTSEYLSRIIIYKINELNKLVMSEVQLTLTPEQIAQKNDDNLFCSQKNGWQIVSGI